MLEMAHEFANGLEMNVIAAHQETDLQSRQDYNGTAAGAGNASVPPAFCVVVLAAADLCPEEGSDNIDCTCEESTSENAKKCWFKYFNNG